jgi:hypothetical protein
MPYQVGTFESGDAGQLVAVDVEHADHERPVNGVVGAAQVARGGGLTVGGRRQDSPG